MGLVVVRKLLHLYPRQILGIRSLWCSGSLTVCQKHDRCYQQIEVFRRLCSKTEKPEPQKPVVPPPQDSKAGNLSDEQNLQQAFRYKKKVDEQSNMTTYVMTLAACGSAFLFLYLYIRKANKDKELEILKSSSSTNTPVDIGGEWELVDQNGVKRTNKDFIGHWCLIYFGFTHCPDICPEEMEKIVEVVNILERNKNLPKVIPIFISLDSERDTPSVVKQYITEFSDKMVGLTGVREQIERVVRLFKVYYSFGPKDEDGDYIVDHSIITYLMNPDGHYAGHFPRSKTNIEIARNLEKKIKEYKK